MAMSIGSITVNASDATYTGTGMAKAILDQFMFFDSPRTGDGPGQGPDQIGGFSPGNVGNVVGTAVPARAYELRQLANLAQAIAHAVVAYIQANAVVSGSSVT